MFKKRVRLSTVPKLVPGPWKNTIGETVVEEVIESYDDEGASDIFLNKSISDVDFRALLDRPTSVWFLTDNSFALCLPLVFATVSWGKRNKHKELANCLEDHFVTQIEERMDFLEQELTSGQFEFLDQFLIEYAMKTQYPNADGTTND